MLMELLLASQIATSSSRITDFQQLREAAIAQENALTPDQRNALGLIRARLYSSAMMSCGYMPARSKKPVNFDAVAEVTKSGKIHILAQSNISRETRCVAKQIGQATISPPLPFMPELLNFPMMYQGSEP